MLLIAPAFLLIFSRATSPVGYNEYGADSAFFITMGKAMLQGYIPYKEIFDLKGPFLWFLQIMGQMINPDKVGMFVLQTIFFEIYLFLSFYCA